MNKLTITGVLTLDPLYAVLPVGKVISFTIVHVPLHAPPTAGTLIYCEYVNPPPEWWEAPDLHKGRLVRVEGEVSLLRVNKKEDLPPSTIHCKVYKLMKYTRTGNDK